jgi:hypothetical protein
MLSAGRDSAASNVLLLRRRLALRDLCARESQSITRGHYPLVNSQRREYILVSEDANGTPRRMAPGIGGSRIYRQGAAYHEAGKAVARIHVGAAPVVAIASDDTTAALGQWPPEPIDHQDAWRQVFVKMAGWRAEARAPLSLSSNAMLRHARAYRGAQVAIRWLAQNRYAVNEQVAWERCHQEVEAFLGGQWLAIERVAWALLERGLLTTVEIAALAQVAG